MKRLAVACAVWVSLLGCEPEYGPEPEPTKLENARLDKATPSPGPVRTVVPKSTHEPVVKPRAEKRESDDSDDGGDEKTPVSKSKPPVERDQPQRKPLPEIEDPDAEARAEHFTDAEEKRTYEENLTKDAERVEEENHCTPFRQPDGEYGGCVEDK
jgi:hypothetical protein